MSKKVLRTGLMIASVAAMFIPGGQIVALGMKIGVGALLSVGLGAATGLLLGPKRPKPAAHAAERLQATLDPNAPRKIWLGDTAAATDVRYQAYTGTDQEYCEQILCVASHEVESIDEIWFESRKAWSASGGVTADFAGYLTVTVRNPGTAANGIAIDAVWTASCTLTGCAYLHLKYKLTGNTKKAEGPFAQQIPSRVTVRGKGAKLYDPRQDSTVAGGSGTQRANDQTTWRWTASGSEAGRNPALARLFVLLGWRINGKLAVGRGVPPARLNLTEFMDAANICDESVAIPGGGSERRYRHDMVYSEGEEAAAVLGNINATMNARPTEEGGKLGVYILRDDLSDPGILSLSDDDLAEPANESWSGPALRIEQIVNVVRGRYTDASDAGLYLTPDYPEVVLPGADSGSPDGIQRIDPFDLLAVQSPTQAQRLAQLRLNRKNLGGIYSGNFKARAWQSRMWRVVSFTHRGLRFTGKKFRVVGQSLPVAGVVRLTLLAEETSLYVAAGGSAVTAPTAPVPWDPANDPLIAGIGDAGTTAEWPSVADPDGTKPDDNATRNRLFRQATAPASPIDGDAWEDTSVTPNLLKIRVAGAWELAANLTTQGSHIGVENGADVTSLIVGESVVTIFADYLGAPKTGEITKSVALRLYKAGVQVTSGVTWSRSLITGNAATSISGTGTGTLDITGPNDATLAAESQVRVTASFAGVDRQFDVKVVRQSDPPPSGGTGGAGNPGTTASTSSFSAVTSTSHAAIATLGPVKAGTAGQIRVTLPASYKRTPGTAAGTTGMRLKAQWRVVGGSYADISPGENNYASVAETQVNAGDPPVNFNGSSSLDVTKTGLTSGTDYEIELQARKVDASGDVDNVYIASGTLTAAGS